ncbi:MAG: hypothetical protein ACKO3C_06290 [Betaproteobacteria bacterium]
MQPNIEITPDGRLLQRRQVETPNGKREKVRDITDEAQHWLDASVTLQSGTRLSAIYELLTANAALRALYKRNWADEYLARYEAICSVGRWCQRRVTMHRRRNRPLKPWCCHATRRCAFPPDCCR